MPYLLTEVHSLQSELEHSERLPGTHVTSAHREAGKAGAWAAGCLGGRRNAVWAGSTGRTDEGAKVLALIAGNPVGQPRRVTWESALQVGRAASGVQGASKCRGLRITPHRVLLPPKPGPDHRPRASSQAGGAEKLGEALELRWRC